MPEIGSKEIVRIAKRRLADIPGLNIEKSDSLVESANGRVTFAPPIKSPIQNIEELGKGAIVGAISTEFAPRGASLEDGSYEVKVIREDGTWVAQFIKENKIVASTVDVRVVETHLNLDEPVAVLIGFSPCILCVFLLGVCVGIYIGAKY